MPSDSMLEDAFRDAGTDLLSKLLVAGVTFVARAVRNGLAPRPEAMGAGSTGLPFSHVQQLDPTSAYDELDLEGFLQQVETEEMEAAGEIAHAFLMALHGGDHSGACELCAQALFDHPHRKTVLLDTLQSASPVHWEWIQTTVLEHGNNARPKYVQFDADVEFEIDGVQEVIPLLLNVRRLGGEWKVWQIHWGGQNSE